MVLIERCRTCKNNWDGHCIVGNDIWKMKNGNKEVECEEYEMGDRLIVTSDGEPQHWFDAKPLCHLELGYGMDSAPESRPQEDPPPAPPVTEPRPYVPVTEAAKQIRRALKAAFPGVKFSVRSNSFSGGPVSASAGPMARPSRRSRRSRGNTRIFVWTSGVKSYPVATVTLVAPENRP